jgi:3-oxoacyl-[acyl-carrier protein] reductase
MDRNMFDLSGKVALVTGGGSGIGRGICEGLAQFGADVACCDIDKDRALETVGLINKFGHNNLAVQADISLPVEIDSMVNKIVEYFGAIDILVNNAGILCPEAPVHETTKESWDRVMDVDLRGVFLCMKSVLPVMIKQQSGSIINISSVNGVKTHDREINPMANYNAAKAGVIALTKQAATEYATQGIRINCIAPGQVPGTNIAAARKRDWTQEKIEKFREIRLNRIPLRRFGTVEDFKGPAVFLASDASKFVIGHTLVVDGGETI